MQHLDTSRKAAAVQLEAIRAMSEEQRILRAFEMSMFARQLAGAAIQQEHPEWPQARVLREVLRRTFSPAPLPTGLP